VTNGEGLGLGIWTRHRGHPQSSLNCVMKRAVLLGTKGRGRIDCSGNWWGFRHN